jgi:hypothetical protein
MRIAVFPIVGVAILSIAVIISLVVAVVVSSRKGKLIMLLPIGAVVLVALALALPMVQISSVRQRAMTELRDRAATEMQTAREEYRTAFQSQVLDYRGDAGETIVPGNASTDDAPSVEVIQYSPSGLDSEQRLPELPEWVGEPSEFNPNTAYQTLVLSSEPWSSVEEADEELYGLLAVYAGQFLSASYPEAEGWYPTREMMNQMPLIQGAVHERVPLQIGEHTVHVQHAHWHVELTPEIRQRLFELWRPTIVQDRLVKLAGGFGAVTLLLAMAAGILRFRQRSRAGVRERAAAVAGIAIMLAGISTLFSA